MLKMAAQGVYWTIQGEGHYCGEPMVFIRLAGCSVGCPRCDTNYVFHRELSEQEIVAECVRLRDEHVRAKYAWVTGGEPLEQDLTALNLLLWDAGFKPCLATSGVKKTDRPWWWLSVSPHTKDFSQRHGAEIKLVPRLNDLDIFSLDLSGTSFGYRYVQPMAGNRESFNDCLEFIKDKPEWNLSPQCHKTWGLP